MTGTIDITCSLPAPTLSQARAWLTRTGWEVDTSPLGQALQECWSHPVHGRAWLPRGDADWLTSEWIANRAWQIESTPEAVYREIVGPSSVYEAVTYAAEVWPVRKACDGCEFLWHGHEGARACHHPSTNGPVGTPRVAAHEPPPDWCPLRKRTT